MWLWRSDYNRAIRGIHYQLRATANASNAGWADIKFQLDRIERTMATQAELDAKIDELAAAASAEMKQLADAIAAIPAAVDLAPQVAKVQGIIDALRSDDPPAAPPA